MINSSVRNVLVLFLTISVLILVAALSSSRHDSEQSRRLYSTYNARPNGTKALYALLSEMELPVERWRRPCDRQNLPDSNVVFITVAPIESFSTDEISNLQQLVESGTVFIGFYAPALDTLAQRFGFKTEGSYRDSFAVRQQLTFHTHDADSLIFSPDSAPAIMWNDCKIILYGSPAGHAVVEKKVGAGSVVFFHSPDVASNAWLSRGDNARAIVHLLQWQADGSDREFGRILFDEYHQGFRDFESSIDLLDTWPIKTGIVLAGVLVILWVISRGKRFGRPVPIVAAPIRSSLRTVDSIAGVYERAKARRLALKSWYRWLMHQWQERFHTTHPGKLADILEKRYGLPSAETLRLLTTIQKRLQEADRAVDSPDDTQWGALDQQEMVSYFSQLEKIHHRIQTMHIIKNKNNP